MKSVAVFCGSSPGSNDEYGSAVVQLAKVLVARSLTVVYGGASVGAMGTLADAVLAAGGEVIGVLPSQMQDREIAHPGLTQMHIVRSMHERKAMMSDLSDGFIALPGGFGTIDEFAEILTWKQLGLHDKPIGILNALNYFDSLLGFFDHMVEEKFLSVARRASFCTDQDPEALLNQMERSVPAD